MPPVAGALSHGRKAGFAFVCDVHTARILTLRVYCMLSFLQAKANPVSDDFFDEVLDFLNEDA